MRRRCERAALGFAGAIGGIGKIMYDTKRRMGIMAYTTLYKNKMYAILREMRGGFYVI